jgi:hypothetical protein
MRAWGRRQQCAAGGVKARSAARPCPLAICRSLLALRDGLDQQSGGALSPAPARGVKGPPLSVTLAMTLTVQAPRRRAFAVVRSHRSTREVGYAAMRLS